MRYKFYAINLKNGKEVEENNNKLTDPSAEEASIDESVNLKDSLCEGVLPQADNIPLDLEGTDSEKIEPTVVEKEKDLSSGEAFIPSYNIAAAIEFPLPEKLQCNYELDEATLFDIAEGDIAELTQWLKDGSCKEDLAFSFDGKSKILFVDNTKDISNNIWFLSDIHGDILALDVAIKYIDSIDKDSYIVFMGDLFDRGRWNIEVLVRVLQLIKSRKNRVMWVAGNHDLALKYSEDKDVFSSIVMPAEFYFYLNNEPKLKDFAKSLIDFIDMLPRAIFFDNGLVCTHGGVPHNDIADKIKAREDFSAPEMLQDFTWTRFVNAIKKRPNRRSKSCDIGKQDVDGFCAVASAVLGFEVKYLLGGHQHPIEGFLQLGNKTKGLIIYTSFHSEIFDFTKPCIARFQLDDAPVPVSLVLENLKDINARLKEIPSKSELQEIDLGEESGLV